MGNHLVIYISMNIIIMAWSVRPTRKRRGRIFCTSTAGESLLIEGSSCFITFSFLFVPCDLLWKERIYGSLYMTMSTCQQLLLSTDKSLIIQEISNQSQRGLECPGITSKSAATKTSEQGWNSCQLAKRHFLWNMNIDYQYCCCKNIRLFMYVHSALDQIVVCALHVTVIILENGINDKFKF